MDKFMSKEADSTHAKFGPKEVIPSNSAESGLLISEVHNTGIINQGDIYDSITSEHVGYKNIDPLGQVHIETLNLNTGINEGDIYDHISEHVENKNIDPLGQVHIEILNINIPSTITHVGNINILNETKSVNHVESININKVNEFSKTSSIQSFQKYDEDLFFYREITDSTKDDTEFGRFAIPPRLVTFTGREDEINKLDYLFFEKNKKQIVISGPDGIGKSELAKQFVQKCANKIDRIFWIPCADEDELSNSSSLLKKMYRQYKNERCLFVFDDCLNRENICKYFPPDNDNYFLLVTSQEILWEDDVAYFQLNPLSTKYAIEVLGFDEKQELENKHWYEELAKIVNNTPLGLQIIRKYLVLNIYNDPFLLHEYVQELKHCEINFSTSMDNSYKRSIYNIMRVSLINISRDSIALNALYICSYLNPDCIYFDDLLTITRIKLFKLEHNISSRILHNSNFLYYIFQERRITIHRLIQSLLRYHLRTHEQIWQRRIYMSCLKYIFEENSRIKFNPSHTKSILNYADENVTIVCEFFNYYVKDEKISENILENLIKYGCYQCVKEIFQIYNIDEYYNLLHLAVKYNQIEILKVLLTKVDIDKTDEQNETILHIAARGWKLKHIAILFEFLPNVTIKNNVGNVPLFELVNRPHFDTNIDWNDVLQMFKFKKDITNMKKQTLLHIAAAKYNDVLVKLLLSDYEMNVEDKDAEDKTPLDVLQDTFSTLTVYNIEINKGMATAKLLANL